MAVSPKERCATGDGCPHLTTEQSHFMSRRDSIHGDKDRHSSCASAILRLERMPDIILFRDCTRHPFYHSLIVVFDWTVTDFFASLWFLFPYCHFLVFLIFHYDAVLKRRQFFWFQCCPVAFLNIGEAIFIWCVPESCGSVGVACQNKRVAKGHSRRSGKISTLRVVFFRLAVNIPSFVPHAFQVSSNSNNHTVFGRMRLKKSPHRYESHRTTYK